jgi:secreted Zn-dependent insulinase-like peptidase
MLFWARFLWQAAKIGARIRCDRESVGAALRVAGEHRDVQAMRALLGLLARLDAEETRLRGEVRAAVRHAAGRR